MNKTFTTITLSLFLFVWITQISAQTNLIKNSDFETGTLINWTKSNVEISSTEAHTGNYSAKQPTAKNSWLVQKIPLQAGKTYRFSAYLKSEALNKTCVIGIKLNGAFICYQLVMYNLDYLNWNQFSFLVTPDKNATYELGACYMEKKGVAYVDDVELIETNSDTLSANCNISASLYGQIDNVNDRIINLPTGTINRQELLSALTLGKNATAYYIDASNNYVTDYQQMIATGDDIVVFAENGSFKKYALQLTDKLLIKSHYGKLDNTQSQIQELSPTLTVEALASGLYVAETASFEVLDNNGAPILNQQTLVTPNMSVRVRGTTGFTTYALTLKTPNTENLLLSVKYGVLDSALKTVTELPQNTTVGLFKRTSKVSSYATVHILKENGISVAEDTAYITANMKISVNAESGISNDYSLLLGDDTLDATITVHNKKQYIDSLGNRTAFISGTSELHILSATNPVNAGIIVLNSDDARVYFEGIKPSEVLQKYVSSIWVGHEPAQFNPITKNIRINQFGRGTVIIPHKPNYNALVVYKDQHKSGDSMNLRPYTFYKTYQLADFNDQISSFVLKKGYMATFAQAQDGTGFSKVFIANNADLEIPVMPLGLDNTTSLVRVLPWNWPSKKGFCGDIDGSEAVNGTWYYNWSTNNNSSLDNEYVMNIWGAGGNGPYDFNEKRNITHMFGYNEPSHTEQSNVTVAMAIEKWPTLLAGGYRLGSPAVADNGREWLYEFMNKADELGYRVDYCVVHWYKGGQTALQFYNWIKDVHNKTGRPIWITEWNNGANWTNEGGPKTYEEQAKDISLFLNMLDTTSWVERYSLYDWVEEWRQMIKNYNTYELTPAGHIYHNNLAPVFYNEMQQYTQQYIMPSAQNFSASIFLQYKVRLLWINPGFASDIQGIIVERSESAHGKFDTLAVLSPTERVFLDETIPHGGTYYYRIRHFNASTSSVSTTQNITIITSNNTTTQTQPKLQIFPNPFKEQINIRFGKADNLGITWMLLNTAGKTIKHGQSQGKINLLQINTFDISPGIYVLHMQYANKQTTTYKIVKTE